MSTRKTKGAKPELLLDTGFVLGESPRWDARSGEWVGVDAIRRMVWSLKFGAEAPLRTSPVPGVPGHIALRVGGGLVAGLGTEFTICDHPAGTWTPVASLGPDEGGNRINDGAVDHTGTLWAGTMHDVEPGDREVQGRLYSLSPGGVLKCHDEGLGVSNGIAWSPDLRTMYVADTMAGVVYAYDFEAGTGPTSGRRVLLDRDTGPGAPDGLAVDSSGALWVARWQGGCVSRYAPSGDLDGTWELPTPQVTALCFGGADLRTVLITTATLRLDEARRRAYPLSGGLFTLDVEVPGMIAHQFGM